jgi:hypothetical protein
VVVLYQAHAKWLNIWWVSVPTTSQLLVCSFCSPGKGSYFCCDWQAHVSGVSDMTWYIHRCNYSLAQMNYLLVVPHGVLADGGCLLV